MDYKVNWNKEGVMTMSPLLKKEKILPNFQGYVQGQGQDI